LGLTSRDPTESKHYSESFHFLAKSVRNPHHLFYCLQQIQFQVQLLSMLSVSHTLPNGRKIEKDFLFGKNLVQCFDKCSNLLTNHAALIFNPDEVIPEVVKGDIELLMLSLQTLTEFALKYASEKEQIFLNTKFDGKGKHDEEIIVSLKYTMLVNPSFDSDKILALFNTNDPFEHGSTTEDINKFF